MDHYQRDLEVTKNLIVFAKGLSYKSTSPNERLLELIKQRVRTAIHEQMNNKGQWFPKWFMNSSIDNYLDEFMAEIADSNLLSAIYTYKPLVLKVPMPFMAKHKLHIKDCSESWG